MIKNVRHSQLKTCAVFTYEELSNILSYLFNDFVTINGCEDGIDVSFRNYEPDVWYDEVVDKLGKYLNVTITSMHIDQVALVWVCYKE